MEENPAKDGITSQIFEKVTRLAALTEEQKEANKKKSRVRARVEHVFGAHESIAACPS
jgi:IS5 family transposase